MENQIYERLFEIADKNMQQSGRSFACPKAAFLYYIKNSSYVLTDSHHGTCFAIIYQKQYIALANATRGKTRFDTVAELLNVKDRVYDNPSDIINNEKIYMPIDYVEVFERMEQEKQRGIQWLEDALEKPAKHNEDTILTVKADSMRQKYGLLNRVAKLERQNKELTENVDNKVLLDKINAVQIRLEKLEKVQEKENKRKEKIRESASWIKNKAKGGKRCLKEHGIKYTINRVLYHLKELINK